MPSLILNVYICTMFSLYSNASALKSVLLFKLGPSMTAVFIYFQSAIKDTNAEERLTPVVLAQHAAQLKQQLVSAHLDSLLGPNAHINLADPDGALAR